MALTRKFLSALGIEAEKVDEIISAHTETVDGLKKEVEQYKSKADSFDKVKAELEELKETAKKSGDYDKLKQEFEQYKAEVQEKETVAAKKAAMTKIAKDAGLSEAGIAKAIKYTDLSSFELDEKGEVKDGKTLLKSLKEEWPEYIQTSSKQGAETATPPQTNGSTGSYKTKEEILAIKDTSARQKAIAENIHLFNGGI